MIRTMSDGNSFRPPLLLVIVVLAFFGVMRPIASQAQPCGTDYTMKEVEPLAKIAARIYGNPAQWTIIFYANQDRLGTNVSLLVPGFTLRLPCVGGEQPCQPPPPIRAT